MIKIIIKIINNTSEELNWENFIFIFIDSKYFNLDNNVSTKESSPVSSEVIRD